MNRRLETIVDRAENWEHYVERHGIADNWWSQEEAVDIIRALLAWHREEDR
jgi:hypothetical protein